jgi:hypothetical protein
MLIINHLEVAYEAVYLIQVQAVAVVCLEAFAISDLEQSLPG